MFKTGFVYSLQKDKNVSQYERGGSESTARSLLISLFIALRETQKCPARNPPKSYAVLLI